MSKKELIRSLRFTLFSISAGVIELVVFTLLDNFTNFNYWVCYLFSLVSSVFWNFTLNRNYTFKSASNVTLAMLKVFAFYIVFTPASTLFGNYLVEKLLWNEYLATGINMILNLVLEFLYDRFYVFKNSIDTKSK
jgi:putative flippase GtrA